MQEAGKGAFLTEMTFTNQNLNPVLPNKNKSLNPPNLLGTHNFKNYSNLGQQPNDEVSLTKIITDQGQKMLLQKQIIMQDLRGSRQLPLEDLKDLKSNETNISSQVENLVM